MKQSLTLILMILIVAFAGCGEESTPTQVATAPEKVGPPVQSGIIYRDSAPVGLTWVDLDAGLRIVIGVDLNEYCAGIFNFDLHDFQDATLPDGRIVYVGSGKVQATVWDFLEFDCDRFTTSTPIASGVVNYLTTDNDLQGTVVNNTNAWGHSANGLMTGVDGDRLRLNAFLRRQFGNESGPKVITQIGLH